MGPPSPSLPDRSIPSLSGATDDTLVDGAAASMVREPMLGRGDSVGRYLLVDPLGRGAMGMVFRAYDPDLDRQVAIKILFEHGGPDARDRLLREAKAMARIHHPNVVTVHDAGVHERAVFIAMEIVDGPSLDRWLDTGPRSRAEILDALAGAARGLVAAHAAGVIHRDFKPANVLVTADGRAKVGDFGLAGIEDPVTGPAAEQADVIGTPAYMSPEQFAGVGIDARSDQFAFAITLHEALYGKRPFIATTWPELVAKVTQGDISPELAARRGRIDAIIRRALAVDPALRFESMDVLLAALERARRPLWRPWAIGAAVAVALGLGLAANARDEAETCEPGTRRVGAVWNASAKKALRIGGSDFTEAFAKQARTRFATALDDYAEAWAAAHDESCAAVGLRAQGGTPAQRNMAQCLESRLGSLEGLVELAAREPLAADRVPELVRALPSIEECTKGSWVPYPADPEAAAQAAALHRRLDKLKLAHLWGQQDFARSEAGAAVEAARVLGDRYLLASALARHAIVLEEDPRAYPLFDEALEVALASGFDALAATIIHELVRSKWSLEQIHSWRELSHLASIARGLIERTSGDPRQLGYLALSEANVMRRANQLDEASAADLRAEAYFVRAGDEDGAAKARLNHAVTELRRGRLDTALPQLEAAVEEVERVTGTSDAYFQAQYVLVAALTSAGRMRDAYEVATAAYASARERYAPHASTFRRVLIGYVSAAGNVGEVQAARAALDRRSEISGWSSEEAKSLDVLDLELMLSEGRFEDVLARTVEMRRVIEPEDQSTRAWIDLYMLYPLYLLGRRDELHARLLDPPVPVSGTREYEGVTSLVSLVALLSDAPPPAGTSWLSRFPTTPYQMTLTEHTRKVVEALASGHDTTATVRRVRDDLARFYHPRETTVRLLELWLAEHERGRTTPPAPASPPAPAPPP